MDKAGIVNEIIKELERQRSELETGLASARQAAMESPGAMQSHSDTTKSQMHTLASNIEKLIKEKTSAINALKNNPASEGSSKKIGIGTLVETEGENGRKIFYLIAPEGGAGAVIERGNEKITSITPGTPLGSALLEKRIGDTAVLKNRTGDRNLKILNIY